MGASHIRQPLTTSIFHKSKPDIGIPQPGLELRRKENKYSDFLRNQKAQKILFSTIPNPWPPSVTSLLSILTYNKNMSFACI